jgi:hypothetical protein
MTFRSRCWLNLDNPVSSTLIIPTVLLFIMAIGFLLVAIFASSQEALLADLRNR